MKLNDTMIRALLYNQKMTQTELAEKVGAGRSAIVSACNGRGVSRKNAEKIAGALGVTVDDITKWE